MTNVLARTHGLMACDLGEPMSQLRKSRGLDEGLAPWVAVCLVSVLRD